jgi:acetylornithine/succinyldiaminopimelate/putrescine aminotransferase
MSRENIANIHNRYGINLVRGEGAYLFDNNDIKYIDFHGGIAVNILGHGDSDINKVSIDQINTGIVHLSNVFYHEQVTNLAKKLCDMTFAEVVYFLNSGTEAVEMAIKICRKFYHRSKKNNIIVESDNFFGNDASIPHIISLKNSFHGRTFGSLSLQKKYTEDYGPVLAGFSQGKINDIESIKNQIFDNTVAIFIEPIQGEGGVFACNKEFLHEVKKICDDKNILLVFDEIQTGIGRTGFLYAYQYFNVEPDILLSGKALGGGFPISAVLMNNKTKNVMSVGDHGTTFGGNILSSAVANIVLEKISNQDTLSMIKSISDFLITSIKENLSNIIGVIDIRGMGLLIGIEIDDKIIDMVALKISLIDEKLLCMISGNVIRLLPSIKITNEDVLYSVNAIKKSITKCKINS